MDVKAYRAQYEKELADAATRPRAAPRDAAIAASAPGAAPATTNLADKIPSLLQTLDDSTQPTPVRVAALIALCAARFLGAQFAAHRAAFLDILRKLATNDVAPELRHPAIEALAQEMDPAAQQALKDGLLDPAKALIGPVKALQLLSLDDHSDVSAIALDLFHKASDLSVKAAALKAMSASPGSQDLFARLVGDKSQPQNLREVSAAGLNFLNPERFADVAAHIVHDDGDYPEIRATVLGVLSNGQLHQRLKADAGFVDQVLKLGAQRIDTLRDSAIRFLGRP